MRAFQHHQAQTPTPLQLTQVEGYSEIYDNAAYGVSFTFDDEDDSDSQAQGDYAPLAPFNSIQGQC